MTLEESIVEHCAPALAGIKAANLYCYFPDDKFRFAMEYKGCCQHFKKAGLRLVILRSCPKKGSYLLCLYRVAALNQILSDPDVCEYLLSEGYDPTQGVEKHFTRLSTRLRSSDGFPHEIGIFLGYPLVDVKGFVEHKGENFTCCGLWKVYGDPEEAQRLFASYKTCSTIYKERFAGGTPITQLIVAA